MIYALTDDLGRLVGTIDAPKGSHGVSVEYGGTREGRLDVAGIGRVVTYPNCLANIITEDLNFAVSK